MGNGFSTGPTFTWVAPGENHYYSGYGSKYLWDNHNYAIGDFNGDGKDDILKQDAETHNGSEYTTLSYAYLSDLPDGEGFDGGSKRFDGQLFTYKFHAGARLDFNGDGKSEFLTGSDTYSDSRKIITFHANEEVNLVSSVTNGLNASTTFNYKTLTECSSIYSKGIDDTNPDVNVLQPAFNVVSSLLVPSGVSGGTNTTEFLYEGLKLHKRGRGLLGFSKVSTTNVNTNGNIVKENIYNYNSTFYINFLKAQLLKFRVI